MRVWYSSARGFRIGVLGLPDDVGTLSHDRSGWRFAGKRVSFRLDQPATVSLVTEHPGWAPMGGAGVMVLGLALIGVHTWLLLLAILCTALLFIGHTVMARWVRIRQTDADGSVRTAYLTPAGLGCYSSAPRALYERLQADVPASMRRM